MNDLATDIAEADARAADMVAATLKLKADFPTIDADAYVVSVITRLQNEGHHVDADALILAWRAAN